MKSWTLQVLGRFVCTLLVLITSPLAGAGSVLCLEAGGRIQIEAGDFDGKCNSCPEEQDQHSKNQGPESQPEDCCIDVGLGGAQSIISRVPPDLADAPLLVELDRTWASMHPPLADEHKSPWFQSPLLLTSTLAIKRSVVLLI